MRIEIGSQRYPCLQIEYGKSRSTKRNKFYWLYTSSPAKWRENWRHISGFRINFAGYYLLFAYWKDF